MKTKPTRHGESDPGFDSKKFWRHYVATVDTDQEWSQERPQPGRGSNRLFLFLLLFHIFLIASVVLFNLVAERPKPVFVDNSIPAGKGTKTGANATAAKAGSATAQQETVSHTVTEADTLKTIAAASGVSQEEIAKMNNINVDTRLAVGSVLRVPQPKAKPAVAVIPLGVQPARVVPEKVVTIKPEPVDVKMFAAVTPTPTSTKKVEAPAPEKKKEEVIANKLPEEKPKPKVEDSPPPAPKLKVAATAKVEDSPPAAKPKAPAKVEDTPPPAKPKPTEAKAVVRNEAPAKNTEPAKPATAKSATTAKAASKAAHTVKPKETFYSISRKYGVNVNDLMKANGFSDPAKLREGIVLKLPK
ncbi:hypothetical protein AYO49_00420 [Verrucomicrobiaceae bacterium SCGC AG-212-N21]|nr:hypothetical protein AYO49_00420 [Verrucomicrobiaceae bacterium SCGC AG-212-N21]